MSLVEFSYSEYEDEPRYWDISNASFIDTNLIVGKNSSGKSRLMSVIATFTRLLAGKQQIPYEPCKFSAKIKLNNREFFYKITFKNRAVINEIIKK
ncbi:MAG: hypothetical protein PHN45_10660 [Methylococcales bacterium]|nr:hypothetical protein [Methylococcales bacterium]